MSFFSFSLFSILSLARLGVRKRDISRHTHAQIMTANLNDENRMPPVDTIDKKKKAYCLRISWILLSKIIRNLLFLNTVVKNNNRMKDLSNKMRMTWNDILEFCDSPQHPASRLQSVTRLRKKEKKESRCRVLPKSALWSRLALRSRTGSSWVQNVHSAHFSGSVQVVDNLYWKK